MNCTECAEGLAIAADVIAGEIVPCPTCGAEMEVLTVEPVTIGPAPAIEEDWGE